MPDDLRELIVDQAVIQLGCLKNMHRALTIYDEALAAYDEASAPILARSAEVGELSADEQEALIREACRIGAYEFSDPAFAAIRAKLTRMRSNDPELRLLRQLGNATQN